ncbi:oligopeptidase A [Saccharospirillum sp. MSK14-1]|uniref:M3 family metallopeptidase n=1 Tax=Saccharospirillum sp. MSK14-1 TaxID=1897632 RepID=UPI000D3792A2|nr:M3 family metallopeptidase [Saccharospirillum sp. MSK14-1]PTY37613.1 oligopeptidase A [Saccharospirillum sp. MSK14-1]
MANPLLEQHELPPFAQFQPDQVVPAVETLLQRNRDTIEMLLAQVGEPRWDNLIEPINRSHENFDQAWALFGHLTGVKDSPELRDAYSQALNLLTEYQSWLGQHRGLFEAYQAIAERDDFAELSRAQQAAIEQSLRDFRLAGVDLNDADKKAFADLQAELAQLSQKYSEQLLDATQAWSLHITDENRLAGLPESARATLRQYAEQKGKDGWLVTLEMPAVIPVMTYADDRELRRETYFANVTKASEIGPQGGQFDNGPVMSAILEKRQAAAKLLGFANHAEVSLATKMADSPDGVLAFLRDLADKAVPQAKREFDALKTFARDELGLDDLQPWDVGYASEKLKEQQYSVSQEELKPYFPVPRVINGLFETAHRLFGVSFEPVESFESYHPDVQLYNVLENGDVIARVYMDIYAREGKRGGAWMDECRRRAELGGLLQKPVAYLTCNFTPPVGDKPSLLTHDEVTTLFHEFGHSLHHMLTKIDVAEVSGINGVAWDAVELPSQFLENWCWEPEALAFISGHVDSGEPLPQALLDKMLAAKNFHSAMGTVRQLEFALFDMELHSRTNGFSAADIQSVIDQVRNEVSVVPVVAENRFQNGFGHIFAGGYSAGYYSYKWAEVLSADAFSRFEEEGVFNTDTGRAFRDTILANGGTQPAGDLFKAFRGREPSVDALLRHSGIAA